MHYCCHTATIWLEVNASKEVCYNSGLAKNLYERLHSRFPLPQFPTCYFPIAYAQRWLCYFEGHYAMLAGLLLTTDPKIELRDWGTLRVHLGKAIKIETRYGKFLVALSGAPEGSQGVAESRHHIFGISTL